MSTPIRIFIATDDRSEQPDRVLEYSIRKNTSAEVEITFMRAGDPGWGWEEWNRGRPAAEWKPKSGGGWGTGFSAFRFAIPALCDYEGKAIYMDSDMICLGDVSELWAVPTPKPWVSKSVKRTCVSVIDCAGMRDVFPPLEEMKTSGFNTAWYRKELMRRDLISPTLPPEWNCFDCVPDGCKLLHYTNMATQPWQPWPDKITYKHHQSSEAVRIWKQYEEESRVTA
jgi:hypothetical protein